MKKFFNGQGTISGGAAILRNLAAALIYGIIVAVLGDPSMGSASLLVIPLIVLYAWFSLSTAKKRLQAFGFKGGFLNLIFPSLTDGTYPNGKESEE